MTKSLSVALLALATLVGSTSSSARADELFSRMSMNSAFTAPTAATEKAATITETPEKGRRVLSIGQLAELLREAGLEPETNEQVATLKYEHSRWKFPVAIALSSDYERIQIAFFLSQFDAQKQPAADRLLGLMSANREIQPAFFSYDSEQKTVVLSTTLNNDQIGPKMMHDQLEQLSAAAEKTADQWENDAKSLSTGNIIGKWSADRSTNEGFALLLNTDGSFVLVSVKNGAQTKSVGKFALAEGQLTLTANDNTKLSGKIANLKPDTFEFTPIGPSATKLTFTRARQ